MIFSIINKLEKQIRAKSFIKACGKINKENNIQKHGIIGQKLDK